MNEFAEVDVAHLVHWILQIDFSEWPQQRPIDHQLRPSMVTDRNWHDFGRMTDGIVAQLGGKDTTRFLSVVMPGHDIEPHRDLQAPTWKYRVHVPIVSNPKALWIENGLGHWMRPGKAYKVDTRVEHAVVNNGETPRIHFMFDVEQ